MTRLQRTLMAKTGAIGIVLTLLVFYTDYLGWLQPIEWWAYDRRAKDCQFFTPRPTDKLVHIDIDDRSLQSIGRWPWRRSVVAELVSEINRAGTKAVALDIIFPESQDPEIRYEGGQYIRIDHDGKFAETVRQSGNVLLPVSLEIKRLSEPTVSQRAMRDMLVDDLAITIEEVVERLGKQGLDIGEDTINFDTFMLAQSQAMDERVNRVLDETDADFSEIASRVLPRSGGVLEGSLIDPLRTRATQILAMRSLMRFSRPFDPADDPGIFRIYGKLPPVKDLCDAAGTTGFVEYLPYKDGVVRSVPLWLNYRDHLFPQLGLSLACFMLGVEISDLQIDNNRVVIPRSDQEPINIPVRTHYSTTLGDIATIMEIPWFGRNADWTTMFDPEGKETKQHISMHTIWNICAEQRRAISNIATADDAIKFLLSRLDQSKFLEFQQQSLPADSLIPRKGIIQEALSASKEYMELYDEIDESELEDEDREFIRAVNDLQLVVSEEKSISNRIERKRDSLRQRLDGKAVIVGWAAAGKVDFKPTPLHAQCPGMVMHGAIFNAILTGDMWKTAPRWATLLITLLIGLIMTFAAAALSPDRALVVALLLGGGYLLTNGILLFDYGNLIVGVAGPMVVVGLVWAGCTLFRFLAERAERARITSRFRSYVDPALVDYVIEHPEQARLEGEIKELSVVFTDLQGFTTLSEKLGPKAVSLIGEHREFMIPIIRSWKGFVCSFMGDGIMIAFGAPRDNPRHAADAVASVLEMNEGIERFNQSLAQRDLPTVLQRAGVTTGMMVVGDAGPPDASDYTPMGDLVNLCARLESANKATGTLTLLSARTVELMGDGFLIRPVAKLQVVGKSEGILTFEPICSAHAATDEQRRLVDMTRAMVDPYLAGEFAACDCAATEYEETLGPCKLTRLYRDQCQQYSQNPPEGVFDGHIVLEKK